MDQCSLSLNNAFSLMWPAAMKSFPQDWFGTAVYTPPASISLAICRWCDICIFNVRNKDVVVVVVVVVSKMAAV